MDIQSTDESAVRMALQAAIPPLREPADRVTEVGTRVRRHRARTAAAAALAVALVLAGASAWQLARAHDAPTQAAAGADCPSTEAAVVAGRTDNPGPIVPSGAIRASLCVRPSGFAPVPDDTDYSPRTLTQNVDQLVSFANSLPGPSTTNGGCFMVGHEVEMSFAFSYADGPPMVVWLDLNCSALRTAGHTRYFGYLSALDTFLRLYRSTTLDTRRRPPPLRTVSAATAASRRRCCLILWSRWRRAAMSWPRAPGS